MKVVLVEDNPSLQMTMSLRLKKLSCSVKVFGSADEALPYLRDEVGNYDVVILDGNLIPRFPEKANQRKNGPDIAAELLKFNKDVIIIPWTDDKDMLAQFAKIFRHHGRIEWAELAKPISINNLVEVLTPYIESFSSTNSSKNSPTRPRAFTS
ncbi:response regulator [Legionella hackeliae]|uniref:Response regulatory domain-containing protein n=1 Tax=Legionella hackeliae TaxID=449 RepID=A0A0A8UVT1_LEGHA|nr:response regulator [Legionella hackeliae]KTD09784.1 two-component response regulator [Legionella hackeliae]CEK10889.1 protein of unknown function [Legionella hackeliae]STX47626.1 two-component response regulator [Legionella hackeliae]